MTKKDFIAIAAVLNANQVDLATVLDMADMLADTNPLFNRGQFVRACTEWAVMQDDYKRLMRAREEA